MAVMFDLLARRYSTLPSRLLREADTFDVWVYDVATSYEQYIQSKEKAGKGGQTLQNAVQQRASEPDPALVEAYNRFRGQG